MAESNPGLNFEWKNYPIWPKQTNLWYLSRDSIDSKKFQNCWNFSILITELGSVTKIEWEKCPKLLFWSKMSKSRGKSEIGWLKSAEISWFFLVIKVGYNVTYSEYIVDFWKFQWQMYFLGHFMVLLSGLFGLWEQKTLAFSVFSIKNHFNS